MRALRPGHLVPFLLLACVPPEKGINRAVIHGTVRVTGERLAEAPGNDTSSTAQVIGPLDEHVVAVDGTLSAFGVDGLGEPTGDVDWFAVTSAFELETSQWVLAVTPESASTVRFLLREPDGLGDYVVVSSEDVDIEAGTTLEYVFSHPIAAGVTYQVAVAGLAGTAATWEFVPLGADPNDTTILVGAYRDVDLRNRVPVGGAEVGAFVLGPDLTWEAPYTIRNVRTVGVDRGQETRVDESVGRIFLFAGSWPSLNGNLPSGTWYSAEPVSLWVGAVPNPAERFVDPLYLDTRTLLVIGNEFYEVEPNDVPVTDAGWDVGDGSTAQDLGVLSGLGKVDVIRGTSPILTADAGWVHDVDAFKFQVEADTLLRFTMDWTSADADIDVILTDTANDVIDHGATAAKPEISNYEDTPLVVGEDYYLLILGYLGTPGDEPAYEIQLEQTAP